MNEEVAKYRELSGDTNTNTPISRIGGYLDGYERGLEILQEIRNDVANWNKTEHARYVPNYDAFARFINLIDEKIGGEP